MQRVVGSTRCFGLCFGDSLHCGCNGTKWHRSFMMVLANNSVGSLGTTLSILAVYSSDVLKSFLSSQSRVRVTSPSRQGYLNYFRVESEQVMTWSSRVKVESQELSSHLEWLVCKLVSMSSSCQRRWNWTFFLWLFLLWNGAKHAIKWRHRS